MKKISVALAFSALLVALVHWSLNTPTPKAESFDQHLWNAASSLDQANDPGCYRGGMAMELVERRMLNDKTGPEVISLLGKPSDSFNGNWTYPVGQCGRLWEHFNLRVEIGPEGKVVDAALVKDES